MKELIAVVVVWGGLTGCTVSVESRSKDYGATQTELRVQRTPTRDVGTFGPQPAVIRAFGESAPSALDIEIQAEQVELLIAQMTEESRGGIKDFQSAIIVDQLQVLQAWLEDLAAFLMDIAVVEVGLNELATDVGNAGIDSENDGDYDFMDLLDALLGTGSDGRGVRRLRKIVNWQREESCGCDRDGDGFIGRPGARDENHNGRCDGDEDCDGDGKPGLCVDCGWLSIEGVRDVVENILAGDGAAGLIDFLIDVNTYLGPRAEALQVQIQNELSTMQR